MGFWGVEDFGLSGLRLGVEGLVSGGWEAGVEDSRAVCRVKYEVNEGARAGFRFTVADPWCM